MGVSAPTSVEANHLSTIFMCLIHCNENVSEQGGHMKIV